MAIDITMRVGRRISLIRREREWTQAMLADHADLTREHVSELENGKKEIGIRTLERVVSALGVYLSDFFRKL